MINKKTIVILAKAIFVLIIIILGIKSTYSVVPSNMVFAKNIKVTPEFISLDVSTSYSGPHVTDYEITKKDNKLYIRVIQNLFNVKGNATRNIVNKFGEFEKIYISGNSESDRNLIWQKYNYIFKDENKSWSAEYDVNHIEIFSNNTNYESISNKRLNLSYKKDPTELSKVKKIEISYQSNVSKGTLSERYYKGEGAKKTYTLKHSTSGSCESKDDTIKVKIRVDGKSQYLLLKSSN